LEASQFAKPEAEELLEEVVGVNRVAKVVKGGRNFRFNAAVVVGNRNGQVGGGVGKAQEISEAIRKAANKAKKSMNKVPRIGSTVPHAVWSRYGGARVMLKPASPGTGVVAGNVVRSIMECAGIQDVVTKCLGSTNPINVMRATLKALNEMTGPQYVRALRGVDHVKATHEDVAAEMAKEKAKEAKAQEEIEAEAKQEGNAAKENEEDVNIPGDEQAAESLDASEDEKDSETSDEK